MTAAILSSVGMVSTAVAADDLLQDAGSWMQVVGEGSLKVVDPSLEDVRVRPRQMIRFMHPLEFEPRLSLIAWDEFFIRANSTPAGGQSGFEQNRAFAGLGWTFVKNDFGLKRVISISIWMMPQIPITPCTT